MRRCFLKKVLPILLALAILPCVARAEAVEAPAIEARSYILVEAQGGEVLVEKNADNMMPIASVNKIMTLLLAMEALERGQVTPDTPVTVSARAAAQTGSTVLLDRGATYTFSELVKATVMASGNDSCMAIAETLAGSEEAFVEMMNARAAALGMNNTHFINCSGLPAEGHYSSARDVSIMSRELIRHPVFFQYSTVWLDELVHPSGRKTMLANTNRLIRFYDGADGIKTGSTTEARYCLSATAKRGNLRLVAVVLGASSTNVRFSGAQILLDYGFANYRILNLIEKDQDMGEVMIKGGKQASVRAVAQESYSLLMTQNEPEASIESSLLEQVVAPVSAGDVLGEIVVKQEGVEVGRVRLVAQCDVERAGLVDYISRIIRALFG